MNALVKKFLHVCITVPDLDQALKFYRDVLGLPLRFSSPGWTEFNTGATTIALHTTGGQTQPAQQSLPPAGQAHLGFIVDDLQGIYETLKAQDVHFSLPPQKQSSGVTLAVLHDPDGQGITLQQR